jgi:hypothetical protein
LHYAQKVLEEWLLLLYTIFKERISLLLLNLLYLSTHAKRQFPSSLDRRVQHVGKHSKGVLCVRAL